MLTAVIENNGNTLVLDFPKSRPILEAELASIEIQELAHEIYCTDEESVPIKVKITGNDDFERIIAAAVHPSDTLAAVNNACDFFRGLPPRSAEHLKRDVLENGLTSLSDFFSRIFREEKETVVEQFYFPLSVTLYPYNDYGDLDEENVEELDGTFAADYEFTIRTRLEKEQRGFDMAETFDGSDSAVEKLRFVKWNVEEIDGCLYGKILARLTGPFDPEERAEFVDWALGQNSDGLGESFEQRPFRTDDGEMYVSFWNPGPDYFICSEDKLDEHIGQNNNTMEMR